MVRLVVDTSSDYIIVIVAKDNNILASCIVHASKKMSELLLSQVDNMLSSISLDISKIDEFYAGVGPGSFTGIRIGVALVLGLSSGSGKSVYGISSLDIEAIMSYKSNVTVVALLKGDLYIVRDYDFDNKVFSSYYIEEIVNGLENYTLINNEEHYFPNMIYAIKSGKLWDFSTECLPIYLRKSEAEINFDKKSIS